MPYMTRSRCSEGTLKYSPNYQEKIINCLGFLKRAAHPPLIDPRSRLDYSKDRVAVVA